MSPEIEKYVYMLIVIIASLFYWYVTQPGSESTDWQNEIERIDLPSLTKIEPPQSSGQKRNPFIAISSQLNFTDPSQSITTNKANIYETAKTPVFDLSSFNISGIIYSEKNSMVNINGDFFMEGDKYKGMLIKKILPEKIIFRFQNKLMEKHIIIPEIEIEEVQ